MSICVRFERDRAHDLLDCLNAGKPIQAVDGKWTGNDLLALAGACFFVALSQGPDKFWLRDVPQTMPPEHQEAREAQFFNDLHAAIEFYGHLSMVVWDGQYDEHWEKEALVLVTQDGEVKKEARPVKGMKW